MSMKPTINDFQNYRSSHLYRLFKNVYSSSAGMSESLEDKYPNLACFEEDITALQKLPGAVALVANIGDEPVAYLTIRPRIQSKLRHTADLTMGVANTIRNHGVGKLIIQAALKRASAAPELEIIYLMVRSDNVAAIRLYNSMGFETLALLNRDIKIGTEYFDGMLMRRFVDKQIPRQENLADSTRSPHHTPLTDSFPKRPGEIRN